MKIILDEMDGTSYADIILEAKEVKNLSEGYLVPGDVYYKRNRWYVGIRLEGEFDEDFEILKS